jgi:ribonuclease HI
MVSREPDLVLYADGGTTGGSPGRGVYYSVGTAEGMIFHERDDSGRRRWSDEAEYLALNAALKIMAAQLHDGEQGLILMDCRPVVRHLNTLRKPKHPRLRELYWTIAEQLVRLEARGVCVKLKWVRRLEVVRILGH